MKRSKKYNEVTKKLVNNKVYSIDEATSVIKTTTTTKFDSSIDILVALNLKDKQKKESVRGAVTLPHSVGKSITVAVVAEPEDQKKAEAAGADFVGLDDLVKKIEDGWVDFDILVATPATMIKVSKLGKVIGKRGLMPNPKNGTVTTDVEKAIGSFKSGKTNFKMLEGGIFQFRVAKASMTSEQIKENIVELMTSINNEIKKFGDNLYKKVAISSSMGPSLKIDVNSIASLIK